MVLQTDEPRERSERHTTRLTGSRTKDSLKGSRILDRVKADKIINLSASKGQRAKLQPYYIHPYPHAPHLITQTCCFFSLLLSPQLSRSPPLSSLAVVFPLKILGSFSLVPSLFPSRQPSSLATERRGYFSPYGTLYFLPSLTSWSVSTS